MKFKIFLALLMTANISFAAKIPTYWFPSHYENSDKSNEQPSAELEEEYGNILDTQSDMIHKSVEAEEKKDQKKSWYLQSIAGGLVLEAAGTIGVLALKGEAAVELVWTRTKNSLKKLQEKIYGSTSSDKAIEESLNKEITDTDSSGEVLNIGPELNEQDIADRIEPIVRMAVNGGKVNDGNAFRENLTKQVKDFQKVIKSIAYVPKYSPWWVYKFQLEMGVDLSGKVSPMVKVGAAMRIRLEWYRIEKDIPAGEKSLEEVAKTSENAKLIMKLSRDFMTLDNLTSRDRKFPLTTIKIGTGLTAKGKIVVAGVKGWGMGSIFMKRRVEYVESDKSNADFDLGDSFAMVAPATSENIKVANEFNIFSEPVNGDKALDADRVYEVSRKRFRKGLRKVEKMAKFFTNSALKREDRRLRKGKELDFILKVIELELEVYIGGDVGLASLQNMSEVELFFVRQ